MTNFDDTSRFGSHSGRVSRTVPAAASRRSAKRGSAKNAPAPVPADPAAPADEDSPVAALPRGTMLFEYRIDAVLGSGGFGITYLAHDTLLDEPVAIKEFFPSFTAVRSSDQSARARSSRDAAAFEQGVESFLEEARIIARFRQPNIMQVRRYFEAHGTGYMVLEFVHGQSLEAALAGGAMPEPAVHRMLSGILDGLSVLHEQAILHRDLKPRNVILRPNGSPVLIDFGAARDFDLRHGATVTQIVSPNYSAPEQYGVGGQQGPWSDFYGLGAILYRAVTGTVPIDSLRRLRTDTLEPASRVAEGRYAPALLSLVDALLAIEPDRRPNSVDAIRTMLEPSPQWPAPAAQAGRVDGPARSRIADRGTGARAASGRRSAVLGLAALAVALAGGSGLWLLTRPADLPEEVAQDARRSEEIGPRRPEGRQASSPMPDASPATPSATGRREAARPVDLRPGMSFKDCPTCPTMVVLPPGSFQMGSADGRPDERPVHQVTFATALAIGQREVTQREWDACVTAGACESRLGNAARGDDPVINLSWLDTQSYLAWLSGTTGQSYRLPSEAEWEYAARGGTTGAFWWGSSAGSDHANCAVCSAKSSGVPTPAGSFPSNPFGLYDTAGNAAEWVQDCWNPDYAAASPDGKAAETLGCAQRVVRGGSFVNDARYLRSASRYRYEATVPYYAHGFRVATEVGRR